MSDLHELTAAEQLRGLRGREISSRDLTEHYLDRIARLDAELGAFVTVLPESALEAAARADELLACGDAPALCGLPLGIKDLAPTAGVRTSFGSAVFADHVPVEDSWTAGLLREAGTVLVGKTNSPEFGASCFTENDVTERPAVTPYAPTLYSSGSSGGAATAVAAGLLPLAHGSDSAGSIRTPAATCHLVGVKPSRGLVSPAPAAAFLNAGTEGPIARTVEDAALLLDVMARSAPGDLYGWRSAAPFVDAVRAGCTRPLKVAMWTETGLESVDPHPEAVNAAQRTATSLRELGHDVREIPIPATYAEPLHRAVETWFATSVGHAASVMVPPDRRALLRPYTRHLMEVSEKLSAHDVMSAHSLLALYASAMLAAFDDFDIALTPTTSGPPVPIGRYLDQGVENVSAAMLAWSCYTPWANFTGQPAVSLPSHLGPDGLPFGVQLVGRPCHDAELLALAAQLEQAAAWHTVHPPHWHQ